MDGRRRADAPPALAPVPLRESKRFCVERPGDEGAARTDEMATASDASAAASSTSSSPSSHWIRAIQNQSFQPKPTPYSPHARSEEDPLMLQQRQCRDKLRTLRLVRERIRFYPMRPTDERQRGDTRATASTPSMRIPTSMIFSGEEEDVLSPSLEQAEGSDGDLDTPTATVAVQQTGIEALGGLELLLFAFFSREDLLRVSSVCRGWRMLARHDLLWEPLLLTPEERYPLRPLLGLERAPRGCATSQEDIPAILVYMVYQRMRLEQTPFVAETDTTAIPATTANLRADEVLRRLGRMYAHVNADRIVPPAPPQPQHSLRVPRRGISQRRDSGETVSSVHLVCAREDSLAPALAPVPPVPPVEVAPVGGDVERLTAQLLLQEEQAAAAVDAGARAADGHRDAPAPPNNANPRAAAGAADDDDVYSVVDGQRRVTLSSWLATQHCVSEDTLRSFLRQMLLAVDALERSGCEHVDISSVNIVVQDSEMSTGGDGAQQQDETDGDVEMLGNEELEAKEREQQQQCRKRKRSSPFFQLFFSRRNCQPASGGRIRARDAVLAGVDGDMNPLLEAQGVHDPDEELMHAVMARHRRRLGVDANGNGNGGAAAGAAAGALGQANQRLVLAPPSMVQSVVQNAITMWARGRFVDANTSALLLLLRHPNRFSSGLRAFLEYTSYLALTRSGCAATLLRHEYLMRPGGRVTPHWATGPIHGTSEYQTKVLAHYSSPVGLQVLVDGSSTVPNDAVMAELMPKTDLGVRYFARALEEQRLHSERFVSVVAPATATSSWVRALARTQTHTLQRLDLSRTRVPMSVLLQELVSLPRLTHLRLPRQILRDENLEHLIAALAYSSLLPHLRGLDDDVRQAMDRMERSYLMQLDMFTFVLQRHNSAAVSGAVSG